jgi:hypothetical protein
MARVEAALVYTSPSLLKASAEKGLRIGDDICG